jgi:curli production assembly/transport component CsgF
MKILLAAFVCVFVFLSDAFSSPLVWNPINPSFGGSPLNAGWILAYAQAQNKIEKKVEPWTMPKTDPIEDFKNTLNRQLLYNLSRRIVDNAFGETGVDVGRYELDDFVIDISTDTGGIKVILTDTSTGNITKIQIPYY